jgi:amino acid transporter
MAEPPHGAGAPRTDDLVAADIRGLHRMGYAQELLRRLGGFSNFAVSFAIICIVAGGLTSYHLGLSAAGGASIGIGWALGCAISLCFALAMAQLGSAFPTAGGLYHWASILGGRGLGWVTAWFNLVGLVAVLAAINVGTFLFAVGWLGPLAGSAGSPGYAAEVLGMLLITASQAWINHRGIRLTARLTDFSGYLILLLATVLTLSMLACASTFEPSRLWTFTNCSGAAGGNVWPGCRSVPWLLLLGLLLPAYTITGFDASAHTAEETIDAARNVPRGIVRSVVWSGLLGWFMVASILLALPSVEAGAAQGDQVFVWVMDATLPRWLRLPLYAGITVAQYLCGLATVTSASRMTYAFARDGGLPCSRRLRAVHPRFRTPAAAIWAVALLSTAFVVGTRYYATLTAVSIIFLYVSYGLPIALGLFAYGRSWTQMGPWTLGRAFRPVAVLCLLGCAVLLLVSVQPPNDKALWITLAAVAVTATVWWGGVRRAFAGPPQGVLLAQRQAAITAAEHALGERAVGE